MNQNNDMLPATLAPLVEPGYLLNIEFQGIIDIK